MPTKIPGFNVIYENQIVVATNRTFRYPLKESVNGTMIVRHALDYRQYALMRYINVSNLDFGEKGTR